MTGATQGLRAQSGSGFWGNTFLSESNAFEGTSTMKGDVNGDDVVNVADIASVIGIIAANARTVIASQGE